MLGGLVNIKNTCYLNTALQCLLNVKSLNNYLLYDKDFKSELIDGKIESILTKSYYETLQLLLSNNVYKPIPFIRNLLFTCRSKGIPFNVGSQEDSQEFLLYILDFIHESIKYKIDVTYSKESETPFEKIKVESNDSWKKMIENDYSKIVELFHGQLMYNIYDENSLDTSISRTFEKYNSLCLPITDDTKNIYDCLNKFITTVLNKDNQYYYEQIKKKINAVRKCTFWRNPKYLIIAFKRFEYDNTKNNQAIEFPIDNLDILDYSYYLKKNKCKYDLISIACHRGGTFCGHYYSLCRKSKNIWFMYNDESVSKIDNINKAVKSILKDVYILIYQQKNKTNTILMMNI